MYLVHTFLAIACLLFAVPNSWQQDGEERAVTGTLKTRTEDAVKKFFSSELPNVKITKITLGPIFFYVTSIQVTGPPDVTIWETTNYHIIRVTNFRLRIKGTFIMFFPLIGGNFEVNSSGGELRIVHNKNTDKVVYCKFDIGSFSITFTLTKKNGKSAGEAEKKKNQLINQIKKQLEKAACKYFKGLFENLLPPP